MNLIGRHLRYVEMKAAQDAYNAAREAGRGWKRLWSRYGAAYVTYCATYPDRPFCPWGTKIKF